MTTVEISALDAQARKAAEKVATKAGTFLLPASEVEWLYTHLKSMNDEIVKPLFNFDVPEIILSIDRDDKRRLGHYKPYRDGLGFKWRVSLNVLHFGRDRASILSTMLHEALHAAQEAHGKPGKGNYHNTEFCGWCERVGIPTDSGGHDRGITPDSPFHAYLKRHGIEGNVELAGPRPRAGGSNLRKWTCDCDEQPIRSSRSELDITCNLCGSIYHVVEK